MTRARWVPAVPFSALGTGCVAAGGLLSAVTAHAPTQATAWAVAYLVLVGGLTQLLFGAGRALLSSPPPSPRRIATEVVGWNAANAAVLLGTLASIPAVLYAGAAVLIAELVLLVHGGRGKGDTRRWVLYSYRGLALLIGISVPVGLVLAAPGSG